jgi:hypothetical protein
MKIFGKDSYCCLCFDPVNITTASRELENGALVAYDVCVPCAILECSGGFWYE